MELRAPRDSAFLSIGSARLRFGFSAIFGNTKKRRKFQAKENPLCAGFFAGRSIEET
jgi:hypothetical protein